MDCGKPSLDFNLFKKLLTVTAKAERWNMSSYHVMDRIARAFASAIKLRAESSNSFRETNLPVHGCT
jgi:hypothetical protein